MTIPAGDTSATFEVRTIEDKVQEGNESFKVRLSSPHNAVIKKSVGYGGIEDDDMPELRLGNAIAEEGQPMIFDLSIVPASNTAFTLNYFTQDKTARAGMDYVAIDAESITIDAGVTARQITVQTLDDLIDEPHEEFRLLVTLPRTVTVIGTGTIFNEDTPPTLTIADASANEGDALVFPVSLSGVSGYPVIVDWEVTPATATPGEDYVAAGGTFYPISVDWALTPGTATAGQDYVAATGTLSIPAGAGGGVIEVVTLQDLLDELDETLTLVMSAPQQARLGEAARALGTIVDDDAAPVLRVEDEDGGVVVVAEEGQALVFTLRLSAPSARTISVDWTIEPGTATVGEDYLATSGAVMLAPGETMTRVEVMTLDDQKLEEAQETVLLTLLNPVNVALKGARPVTLPIMTRPMYSVWRRPMRPSCRRSARRCCANVSTRWRIVWAGTRPRALLRRAWAVCCSACLPPAPSCNASAALASRPG